jgi:hypothetical protein
MIARASATVISAVSAVMDLNCVMTERQTRGCGTGFVRSWRWCIAEFVVLDEVIIEPRRAEIGAHPLRRNAEFDDQHGAHAGGIAPRPYTTPGEVRHCGGPTPS